MASFLLKRVVPTTTSFTAGSIKPALPLFIARNLPSFVKNPSNPNHLNHNTFASTSSSSRPFSTTAAAMASQQFLDTVKNRRTIYALKKESTISDAKVQEIITQVLLTVPSSFNAQSSRVVLLVKEEHTKLWDIAKETLKAILPAEAYPASEQRLNGFQGAYGTVLFFIDSRPIDVLKEKFALYAEHFAPWGLQSDGMHQFAVWTALEAEGLGANLQHYNPLISPKVAETWNIPKEWQLTAQLVFGTPIAPAGEKVSQPIADRFKSYGI